MSIQQITGIVLAGGRSSRFGRDKGLFPYMGKPLVVHALDILRPNFPDLRISTNDHAAYSSFGVPMIADVYPGCGPLGGMHAALQTLVGELPRQTGTGISEEIMVSRNNNTAGQRNKRMTGIAVISCDTPFVAPDLYAFLLKNLRNHDAVVPVHRKQLRETTCAIYTTACLPAFEKAIHEKTFKIQEALKDTNTLYLEIDNTPFYKPDMFHNINHPDDLLPNS